MKHKAKDSRVSRSSMLAEIGQYRGYASSATELKHIFRQFKAGKGLEHPILDRVQSNPVNGPTLMFDLQCIEQRMEELHQVASEFSATVLLAVKSCPDTQYLGVGKKCLDGFDVSNHVEYELLPGKLEGKLVSITSPDLNDEMDRFLVKGNSAVVAIDSQTQMDAYLRQESFVPFMLRINASDLLKNTHAEAADEISESRFGFTVEGVKKLLREQSAQKSTLEGLHLHHGSETNQHSTYLSMIKGLGLLAQETSFNPKYINLGGGWHNMSVADIREILREARRVFPLSCAILLEPGRYFAENSGFGICTIVNQVFTDSVIKYTVNLSQACHLKWSDVNLVCPVNADARKLQEVQFFGPSCYEGDMIGRCLLPYNNDLPRESGFVPGSQVVFSGVTTYSAAWNTSFNGIPKADFGWWSAPQ